MRYNMMWEIFAEAMVGKPDYIELCIEKISGAVTNLI